MDKLNYQKGFLTIEIMIAMVLIILALGAALMVAFGNQSILIDGQTNAEALNLAQRALENEQALARKDFKLVNPESETDYPTLGSTYKKEIKVTTLPDFFTKKVEAIISWPGMYGRTPSVSLTSLVTNFENAVGGDTTDSVLTGDWTNPEIKNSTTDFGQLISDSGNIYTLTDVDAYKNFLYITAGTTTNKPDSTLFVFNTATPSNPVLLGKIDNADTSKTGLSSVRVAEDTVNDKLYAFTASSFGADFSTCPQGPTCAQLQIFDVTDPANPSFSSQIPINLKFGNTGNAGQAVGNSIFYKNGYVYLGLTTGGAPEFNIIDVHNPLIPSFVGSYSLGATINAIFVSGNYVYLATPDSQELTVLDISSPASPTSADSFDASGGGNGKSLYSVGDTLFLGRTVPNSGPEFYALNNCDPALLSANNISSLTQEINDSVNDLIIRDYLAFILTNSELQEYQINNTSGSTCNIPNAISLYTSTLSLPASGSATEPSMDGEGNYIYVTSNDSLNKGFISVVAP